MGGAGDRVLAAWALGCACLLGASEGWGQELPSEGEELEVVVEGEPEDRSHPVTVSSTHDLELEASGRVENAVTDMPGATQFRRSDARSAHPTSQGLTLRGLGGNAASRVLVLYDGVPQADPFGGWIAWPAYDALPLSQARLERGGGSGVYGSGALGGTLDIVTARPRKFGFEGAVLGGSRDAFSGRLSVALPTRSVTSVLGATFESSSGFVPIAAEQRGAVDGPAPYQQFAGALRSWLVLSKRLSLEVTGRAFSDARARGVPFTESHSDGLDLSVRLRQVVRGGGSWSLLAYVQDRELRSSFASVTEDRSSAQQVLDQYSVPSTGWGARFELAPDVGRDARVHVGADWRTVLGQTNERYFFVEGAPTRQRRAGGQNDTVGAFAAVDWRLLRTLTLSASARADVTRLGPGFRQESELDGAALTDESFESRGSVEPTARVGVGLEVTRGLTLRSATYTGFRLPTLNELYRPFRVGADATAANEKLTSERLFGTEIGVDWRDVPGLGLSLTAFEHHLLGAISNMTLGEGPGDFPGVGFVAGSYARRENVAVLRSLGVEALLELDGEALLDVPLEAELGYAHAHARMMDERIEGSVRPAQVPANTFTTRVTVSPLGGRLRLSATVRYVGAQFDDDRNVAILDDATTVDLVLRARLVSPLSLVLRAENVTGTEVEVAKDALGTVELGAPRTVWLGVGW